MDNRARAGRIRMILMDVDGTLTDGTLTVQSDGEELKSYHVHDGMGIFMAHLMGFRTGIITGKTSKGLEKRAKILNIQELHQGILDKKTILEKIAQTHGLDLSEIAYIGDDRGDLSVMSTVGFAAAVADAHHSVKDSCHMICTFPGGRGAVREFIEFILESQGYTWEVIEKKLLVGNLESVETKTP